MKTLESINKNLSSDDVSHMSTPTDLNSIKQVHDMLLNMKPSTASHDAENCPFCAAGDGCGEHEAIAPEGGDMSKTYTEDELNQAIHAAVEPLKTQLAEIKASQEQEAIEARIAELEEAHATEVAELKAQLDNTVAEAEAHKAEYENLVAFLEEERANAEAAAAYEARKEEVAALVKEHTPFSDEHIEANLDRWASLDAEVFEANLADWKAAAEAAKAASKKESEGEELPTATAMQASAQGREGGSAKVSDVRKGLHANRSALRTIGPRV